MLAVQSNDYDAVKLLLDSADGATKQMILAADHQGVLGLPIGTLLTTCWPDSWRLLQHQPHTAA